MVTWLVRLDFNDGNGWQDITNLVLLKSLNKTHNLMTNLKSNRDVANFTIQYNSTIYNKLLSYNNINCNIQKDSVDWFTGIVKLDFNFAVNTKVDKLQLKIIDNGEKLELQNDTIGLYSNYYVVNNTNKSTSLVHQILYKAGYTDSEINITEDILQTIDEFLLEKVTFKEILAKLLFEFGYIYYFDESGKFNIYNFVIASTTTSNNFDNSNMYGNLIVRKKQELYEAVKLIWEEHETLTNQIIASDTTGGTETQKANIDVAVGEYYPEGSDSKNTFIEYKVENKKLVVAKNVSLDLDYSGTITTEVFENNFTKAKIRLKNDGTTTATITKLDVLGDVVVVKQTNTTIREIISGTKKILEYNSKYLHNSTDADNLVNYLAWYYYYADFTYEIKSDANYNIGDIVHLTDSKSGIDTYVRIINKKFNALNENLNYTYIYICEGISAFTSGSTTTEQDISTISNPQTTNTIVENVPTYEEIIETGFDVGNGTTTPEKPVWLTSEVNYRTITLTWQKQWNLTNWDYYEIQVSENGTDWYDFEGNSGGTTKVYQETTTFVGDFDNGNPKTYYFRIRQITKTNNISDWSDVVSKNTNPIGYNQDGMIYYDNNNFWDLTNGSFRIGDANKYIYFDGNNVYFSSVDAEFTNSGVSVYNPTKTIQENVCDGKINWKYGNNYENEGGNLELYIQGCSSLPSFQYIKIVSCSTAELSCSTCFWNNRIVIPEVEIYDVNGCNVALNKCVIGSFIKYKPTSCFYGAEMVVDGNKNDYHSYISCDTGICGNAIINLGNCYDISSIRFYGLQVNNACTKFCQVGFYGSTDCVNWTEIKAPTDYILKNYNYTIISTGVVFNKWIKLNGSLQLNCEDHYNSGFLFSEYNLYLSSNQNFNTNTSYWERLNTSYRTGSVLTIGANLLQFRTMDYCCSSLPTIYQPLYFNPYIGGTNGGSGTLCIQCLCNTTFYYNSNCICYKLTNGVDYIFFNGSSGQTRINTNGNIYFKACGGSNSGYSCFRGHVRYYGSQNNYCIQISDGRYIHFLYSGHGPRIFSGSRHLCMSACSSGSYTDNAFNYYIYTCGYDYHHGALNSGFWHHHTDRGCFYWNKPCYACGGFHTYSDIRTKTDIKELNEPVLSKIINTKVYKYKRIKYIPDETGFAFNPDDINKNCEIGLIAQCTLKTFPEIVNCPNNKITDLYSIKETEAIYYLFKGFQEMYCCIKNLEECIKKLGG